MTKAAGLNAIPQGGTLFTFRLANSGSSAAGTD